MAFSANVHKILHETRQRIRVEGYDLRDDRVLVRQLIEEDSNSVMLSNIPAQAFLREHFDSIHVCGEYIKMARCRACGAVMSTHPDHKIMHFHMQFVHDISERGSRIG